MTNGLVLDKNCGKYRTVQNYIVNFDIGIIPYKINDYTESVYPCKLNEYLAMGIPVVTTGINELKEKDVLDSKVFSIADNNDEFDFIYLGGTNWDPESEGYVVNAPDGSVLVDQNSSGQVPESVTDLIVCQNNTGLNEASDKESVRLYPNPANALVTIQASQFWLGATIQVIDARGKDVITLKDWNREFLDVSNLHSGLYIFEMKTSEQTVQKRLIIE